MYIYIYIYIHLAPFFCRVPRLGLTLTLTRYISIYPSIYLSMNIYIHLAPFLVQSAAASLVVAAEAARMRQQGAEGATAAAAAAEWASPSAPYTARGSSAPQASQRVRNRVNRGGGSPRELKPSPSLTTNPSPSLTTNPCPSLTTNPSPSSTTRVRGLG